jgi:hypothetical protein
MVTTYYEGPRLRVTLDFDDNAYYNIYIPLEGIP